MNNWREVWKWLENGRHVVLRGAFAIEEPDPAQLRLVWIDCEVFAQPRGTLNEACRRMDQLREAPHPLLEAAAERLRAGVRRHLLGEDPKGVEAARYLDAFQRGLPEGQARAALLLRGIDRADAASLEMLERWISEGRTLAWPLIFNFEESEPLGPAKRLLEALEHSLPPEAFWSEEGTQGTERLQALPSGIGPLVLRVLRAGATIGERFESEVLAQLLAIDELEVLAALQEAKDHGVPLTDRGHGIFRLEASWAAQLRQGTLPSLSRAWHERLAQLFGGLPAPLAPPAAPAAARADEWPQSSSPQTIAQKPAGAAASTRVPGAMALPISTHGPASTRASLHLPDEHRSAAHAEAAGLWEAASEQHLAAAERATLEAEHRLAIDLASRALALSERIDDRERRRGVQLRALLVIGRSRWQHFGSGADSSLQAALDPLLRCRALIVPNDPPELRAELGSLIANVQYDIGTPEALEQALQELTRASQILLDAGLSLDAARLLNDEAAVWVKIGDPVRANHLLTRSHQIFTQVAGSYPAARIELLETEHLLARLILHTEPRPGREHEAIQLGIEHGLVAEEGYRELRARREVARVWETLGRLEMRLDRLDAAARRLDDARQVQIELCDGLGLARSSGALCELFVRAGDYPRALERLAESVAFNAEKGSRAGLQFNLESLRSLEGQLPGELSSAARGIAQRIERGLS